jgi:hypothetical protein
LLVNFFGRRDAIQLEFSCGGRYRIFFKNVSTQVHTFITDENMIGTGNQPVNLFLGSFAK